MQTHWSLALGLIAAATLVALACLLILSALQIRRQSPASLFNAPQSSTVFIFDGETLLDATPPARALIAAGPEHSGPWFRLLARLEPIFPGLFSRLEGLQREGRFVLCSREELVPPMVLRAEYLGGLTRLTLSDGSEESAAALPGSDGLVELALRDELDFLRQTLANAPLPVWHESPEGDVTWANEAYLALATERLEPGKELSWPLPALFRDLPSPAQAHPASLAHNADEGVPSRPLTLPGGPSKRWFQLVSRRSGEGAARGARLRYALPADALIGAEESLRDFTQTLAKTFAQLPIGLAIFDNARLLQMFNPALMDLTSLPAEFLISRPSLPMLLDAMREASKLPEPKDYRSWRQQMVEMEQAASEGLFQDTWMLPGGQTWRVSGRPHPNGALAFMIEDISNEMSRTRRYRADLELAQAVIDAMSDAVVVFAQDGSVAMVNAVATSLWGEEIRQPALPATPGSRPISLLRQMTAPTLLWTDLEAYIGLFGSRSPWEGDLRLSDGRALICRVAPMPHGATLVTFTPAPNSQNLTGGADASLLTG